MSGHAPEGTPEGRRGPYRKTAARRREILDAALAVFGRHGYRGGSVREIAALVGMSAPGLLHHFGSKDALLVEVLRHRDLVDAEIVAGRDRRGAGALAALVETARRNTGRRGLVELFCVLAAEATDPAHPAHAFFAERYTALREALGEAFAYLRRTGGLRPGVEPERAARSVVGVMDGLQAQWLLDETSVDMPGDLAAYLRGLLTEAAWADVAVERVPEAPPRTAPAPPAGRPSAAGRAEDGRAGGPRAEGVRAEPGRAATIQDVARATGVSIASVSRALNGKAGVSPRTRATVLAAAADLGFTGSPAARALKAGRTGRVAVTLPLLSAEYTAGILAGAAEVIQAGGWSLVVGTAGPEGGRVAPVLERLGRQGVDGALLVLPPPGDTTAATAAHGVPVVLVDPVADPGPDAPCVTCDDAGGGRQAAEHLLGLGHTRVAVVAGERGLRSAALRVRGFAGTLAAAGVPLDDALVRHAALLRPESAYDEAVALLTAPEPPTAVFAVSDRLAAGVLRAAADLGLDVPGRLSVVGFDDAAVAGLVTPALTTIRQPLAAIGAAAARMLLDACRRGDAQVPPGARVELPTELVVRASTAPPPA